MVELGIHAQLIRNNETDEDDEEETVHIPKEDKIKNDKALSLIQEAISDELFPCIRNEKTKKRLGKF